MFHHWSNMHSGGSLGFVLIAALGLGGGYLLWGRKAQTGPSPDPTADLKEVQRLRAELASCQSRMGEQSARIAALEARLAGSGPTEERPDTGPAKSAAAPAAAPGAARPGTLMAPRGGKADDLKRIKGIGPRIETLLHGLGIFHFDQIAGWSPQDLVWVDDSLENFKGRASRENWVAQAKALLAGTKPGKGGAA